MWNIVWCLHNWLQIRLPFHSVHKGLYSPFVVVFAYVLTGVIFLTDDTVMVLTGVIVVFITTVCQEFPFLVIAHLSLVVILAGDCNQEFSAHTHIQLWYSENHLWLWRSQVAELSGSSSTTSRIIFSTCGTSTDLNSELCLQDRYSKQWCCSSRFY